VGVRPGRIVVAVLGVALAVVGAACSGSSATAGSTSATAGGSAPPGWKISHDSTGSCEVSAPPSWVLGKDFYLERSAAVPAPVAAESRLYPPMGADAWPSAWPSGHWYQQRTSIVYGPAVCSVWRAKASSDFTADEKAQMDQVGKTLKVVP
jgi:hypothetical protein